MFKKKTILSLLLSVVMVCACAVMASCDVINGVLGGFLGNGESGKFAVTWEIDANAVVTVLDASELPSEVDENSKLTFTAEGKNGYDIEKVNYEIGGKSKKATATNGKYEIPVTGDVKITVTTEPAIESVVVTTNPTNMTYYTGDVLDTTGMVVTVNYKTGASEVITNYTVNYAAEAQEAFACGDTGFTVSYRGYVSAPVEFVAPVETKVVLNPAGGVISAAALETISSAAGINNYTVEADGSISFTFASLETAIALPTDVVFPAEEGGWPFGNWQTEGGAVVSEISNEAITTSVVLTAKYQVQLIEVKKVYMGYEGNAPYLYVDVDFVNDGTVFLFLYEGNAKISLKGEDVTAKQGAKKTISLELKQLAEATADGYETFEGKWMDIRINADIHGVVYSTNVVLNPADALADVGDTAHDADNMYKLHYYMNGNSLELKVVYRPYKYSYTIEAKEIAGVPTLVIEGKLNTTKFENYAGGSVNLVWAGTEFTGTIAEDGSWTLSKPLADIETAATTAGVISFTANDGTAYDTSTSAGNYLDLMQCETMFPYSNGEYNSHRSYALVEEVGPFLVAIGCDWTEPFLAVENLGTKITADKFELVVESDVPYGVITGTYGASYTEETVVEALGAMYLDMQQYNTWARYINSTDPSTMGVVSFVANNGTYQIKVDLSGMNTQDGYYIHVADSSANWTAKEWTEGQQIEAAGKKYTLGYGSLSWATSLMTIWVENSVNPEFAFTSAAVEVKDGAPYLVISGTWNTATCDLASAQELLAAVPADLQHSGDWAYAKPTPVCVVNADGTLSVSLNLTDCYEDDYRVWYVHLNGKDLKAEVVLDQQIVVGGFSYSLVDGTYAHDWLAGMVCVKVVPVQA